MGVLSARSESIKAWSALSRTDTLVWIARVVLAGSLLAGALYYGFATIHWPLALDSPVMHYVNFLMRHGMRPYVDITDNNMPGAYFTEGVAMQLFGGGDLAWRIYDFFLLAVLTAGLVLIAEPHDWLAGLFAGCMFIVLHGPDGPGFAVEREQVVAVLLVVGYVSLFRAVRAREPLWSLLFGVAMGLAASIKPTFFPLGLAVAILAAFHLRRQRIATVAYISWAVTGLLCVFALDVGFLLHHHALAAFIFILRHVMPAYVRMSRASLWHLLATFDHKLLMLLAAAVPLAVSNWRRMGPWSWERWAVALGAGFSLLSYVLQGKHFPPHRYPAMAFLLLLLGWEILTALRSSGWPRLAALIVCLFVVLWVLPRKMIALHLVRPESPFTTQLETDLRSLGGTSQLQNKVQCFDLVYGCLNALYHLQLVENTGFTGDLLLFSDPPSTATQYYRERFWREAQRNPASVLVVSNEWFERSNSYAKLDRWPEFETYLASHYSMAAERVFAMREGVALPSSDPNASGRDSYRIYLLHGSAEAAKATLLER